MPTLEVSKDPKGWRVRVIEEPDVAILHKDREAAIRILAGSLADAKAQLQPKPEGGYLATYSQISAQGASESQAKAELMKRLQANFLEQLKAMPR